MSLLSRLRAVFNPPVEMVPDAPVEDYQRSTIKKPSQASSAPSTFAPTVPWATETNPAPSYVEPAPLPSPPIEDPTDPYGVGAPQSGCFIQHTAALRNQLSYTGLISMSGMTMVAPSYCHVTGYVSHHR